MKLISRWLPWKNTSSDNALLLSYIIVNHDEIFREAMRWLQYGDKDPYEILKPGMKLKRHCDGMRSGEIFVIAELVHDGQDSGPCEILGKSSRSTWGGDYIVSATYYDGYKLDDGHKRLIKIEEWWKEWELLK